MLPPGPKLPALAQTLMYLARPDEFLMGCHARYGDVFRVETVIFGEEIAVVRPEHVRQVFTGDPDVFRAGEANQPLEPVLGQRSVLLLDGPEHIRQRKLMLPPFHGDRMMLYAEAMRDATERAIATWRRDEPFALHPHMQRITLDVILRTIFGAADDLELQGALAFLMDRMSSPAAMVSTLPQLRHDVYGLSPWAAFKRRRQRVDEILYRRIRARRDEGAGARDDVLSLLLGARDDQGAAMTDQELRDELVTLLAAGHETTATELCWAFDQILGSPRVVANLTDELARVTGGEPPGPEDLPKLEYLDATLKEALRIRPVIPAVGRRVKEATTIGGFDVPAGAMLVPSIWITHRLPDIYPDPNAFLPERFLGKKPDPYAWFPFGGGVRRCLGMAFAMTEMKVVLGTILARASLRRAKPEAARVRLRSFTHAPANGTRVVMN